MSADLKEYGKGYSYENLHRMAKISQEFSYEEIMSQPVTQIAWSTLVTVILPKSKTHEEMLWYINKTHKYCWSRSEVIKKYKEKTYERNLIEPDTSMLVKKDNSIKELFKDIYYFDFLNRDNTKTEKDLTDSLVDNVIKFIQELGSDFAFVGREYKLLVPGGDIFYIDILMYNLEYRCYVVIEVKNRKFKPQDLGQLLFYVNAINSLKR